MTLIGETKEEDREIFAMLKHEAKDRRLQRQRAACKQIDKVRLLVDNGLLTFDQNGTWNWKLKGVSGQYWPTKGRWQYVSKKLIDAAKKRAWKEKHPLEYMYQTKDTQFGGGIEKFILWLEREQ